MSILLSCRKGGASRQMARHASRGVGAAMVPAQDRSACVAAAYSGRSRKKQGKTQD
jgi:hypothetical protein